MSSLARAQHPFPSFGRGVLSRSTAPCSVTPVLRLELLHPPRSTRLRCQIAAARGHVGTAVPQTKPEEPHTLPPLRSNHYLIPLQLNTIVSTERDLTPILVSGVSRSFLSLSSENRGICLCWCIHTSSKSSRFVHATGSCRVIHGVPETHFLSTPSRFSAHALRCCCNQKIIHLERAVGPYIRLYSQQFDFLIDTTYAQYFEINLLPNLILLL